MANAKLKAARKAKNDEFYTQLTDIENELRHYRKHFRNKVVFCNCDDPFESNFFKFFAMNFNKLKLKKLICTCYGGSPIAGTDVAIPDGAIAYKAVITRVRDTDGDGAIDMHDVQRSFAMKENELVELEGNGDFRSEECIKLLKEADIVVTNPPFSLFREYVAQLMKFEKKFLIIGNMNAITYKEFFPLLMNNKVWTGFKCFGGGMDMIFPASQFDPDKVKKYRIDDYGNYIVNIMGCIWYTNLDHKKRHEELVLVEQYSPVKYPKYDNYDAIEVGRVNLIPCDYKGVMGVPITFLDKYNPDQFEIVGLGNGREHFTPCKDYENPIQYVASGKSVSGNAINRVLVYKLDNPPKKGTYYTADNAEGYLVAPYARVLVRNKNPEVIEL